MEIDASCGGLEPSEQSATAGADVGGASGSRFERLGDYHILQELGRGGMGVVYEAERESLKVRVALKVMHPTFRTDATHLRRFHAEARSAARLHHTNIVPVFDYGEQDGICYYAMQMIIGVGLNRVLDEARQARSSNAARHGRGRARNSLGQAGRGPGAAPVSFVLSTVSHRLLTGGFATGPAGSPATDATAAIPNGETESPGPAGAETPSGTASSSAEHAPSAEPDTSLSLSLSGSTNSGRYSETAWHREIARLCARWPTRLTMRTARG